MRNQISTFFWFGSGSAVSRLLQSWLNLNRTLNQSLFWATWKWLWCTLMKGSSSEPCSVSFCHSFLPLGFAVPQTSEAIQEASAPTSWCYNSTAFSSCPGSWLHSMLPSLNQAPVFARPFAGTCAQGCERGEAGAGFLSSNELLALLTWCLVALHLAWTAEGVCQWSHCCGFFHTSALPFSWRKHLCSHVVVWMAWKVTNSSSLFLSWFSARPVPSPVYSAAAQRHVLAMRMGQCGHGTVFSGAMPTYISLKFVTLQSQLAIPLISPVVLLLKR